MIATDHQYAVTADRLARFEHSLQTVVGGDDLGNPFARAQASGLREQVRALKFEMSEYDALRSGSVREIVAETLADLPIALIKARIARGLSQSALAELLGSKQQLVQRWEAERFRGATFETLTRVARILRVHVSERIDLSAAGPVPIGDIRRALAKMGFPREIFRSRLMPSKIPVDLEVTVQDELDARLELLMGMNSKAIVMSRSQLPSLPMRHKLPGGAEQGRTRAYSTYVAGLCAVVAKCVPRAIRALPPNWRDVRRALFADEPPRLGAGVEALWDHGIAVLPLSDPVAFHGACWRRQGRTVIVVKQGVANDGRWLFDLLHETYHAVSDPRDEFMILESAEASPERRNAVEERRADRFAAEIMTNGRTEQLTDDAVAVASGAAPRLKAAVVRVADRSGVPVGVLANLLAHRLAANGDPSWWATATAMQAGDEAPWTTVRDIFLRRADIVGLSRLEADLLMQSLETPEGAE